MRCVFVGVALLLGCGSSSSSDYRLENRVVNRAGDTCGDWLVDPPGSPVVNEVRATCAMGLTCAQDLFVNPPGEPGNHFGVCLPEAALRCDIDVSPVQCPAGYACIHGAGIPDPGQCFISCGSNAECAVPYQLCDGHNCRFKTCPTAGQGDATDSGSCPAGARCDRGICRRG